MPFLLKVIFEEDFPTRFRGWIDGAFGDMVKEDTPFAYVDRGEVRGFIVVGGRMLLLERANIRLDSILTKGDFLTNAAAEGDEIPYGRANCRFVEDLSDPAR
jgi:hypothetical protein